MGSCPKDEQKVTLQWKLPRQVVRPQPIEFDVAETFQAFVRVAMTHAVDHLGARNLELCVASNGRSLHVELRVPRAQPDVGTREPRDRQPGRPSTDIQGSRLEKLKTQLEAVGGQFEIEVDAGGEVRLRASARLSPVRH